MFKMHRLGFLTYRHYRAEVTPSEFLISITEQRLSE